jgi:hypothetical protein
MTGLKEQKSKSKNKTNRENYNKRANYFQGSRKTGGLSHQNSPNQAAL